MKILCDESDFDGACALLAANNPIYGGDHDKVAASIRESLKALLDPDHTYVATGGYVLVAEGGEEDEDVRHVEILVRAGVTKPYKEYEVKF